MISQRPTPNLTSVVMLAFPLLRDDPKQALRVQISREMQCGTSKLGGKQRERNNMD